MKKKLLNIFIIINFAWTIINAIYFGIIPEHIREMLPQYNWLTALVSGGATGLFGSSAVWLKSFMNNNEVNNNKLFEAQNSKIIELLKNNKDLVGALTYIKSEINNLKIELNRTNINEAERKANIDRLIKLQETVLESRLSNPLLEKNLSEKIRGVLNETKEETSV